MYEEQLKGIGLTENEVRIYLLLLKKGLMNPSEISQILGFHRGYVYDALERMQEKEVISSILKDGKKNFQAIDPESLLEVLKLRLDSFEKLLPELKKIISLNDEKTKVDLFKGKKVYRILIRDIISSAKKNEEILIIGIDEQILLNEIEPVYLKQYFNILIEKNIKERVIIKNGSKKIKNKNIRYKELDECFIGNTSQIIYNNKVGLFLLGDPYYLILIDNKQVYDTYKKQFEIFWNLK